MDAQQQSWVDFLVMEDSIYPQDDYQFYNQNSLAAPPPPHPVVPAFLPQATVFSLPASGQTTAINPLRPSPTESYLSFTSDEERRLALGAAQTTTYPLPPSPPPAFEQYPPPPAYGQYPPQYMAIPMPPTTTTTTTANNIGGPSFMMDGSQSQFQVQGQQPGVAPLAQSQVQMELSEWDLSPQELATLDQEIADASLAFPPLPAASLPPALLAAAPLPPAFLPPAPAPAAQPPALLAAAAPTRTGGRKSKKQTKPSPKRFFCQDPACLANNGAGFTRKADLLRHQRSRHQPELLDCPAAGCPRNAAAGKPFTRRDHLVEHLRGLHQWTEDNLEEFRMAQLLTAAVGGCTTI